MQPLPRPSVSSGQPAGTGNTAGDPPHDTSTMLRLDGKAANRLLPSAPPPLSHAQTLREAVLLCFCEPMPAQSARLEQLSERQWQPLMHWLDTSGLALYFLDRVTELELCAILPPAVLSRLRQSLADNTARTHAMMVEWTALHRLFQRSGLAYATLKGFSLWPISVPKMELRSQLDLDFLVSEESAPEARKILEALGYRLQAISGRSWEFKTARTAPPALRSLYKANPQRSVELHLELRTPEMPSRLAHTESRCFQGVWMPVLSPLDLFLGQGLHLYKHICDAFFRTAHLVEFRRHVLVRHHDDAFWKDLRQLADRSSKAPIALGVVTLLISQVMGEFAPEALTCWTVDLLPPAARLWVELYGRRAAFCNFPGSKLYLLLQRELEGAGVPATRSLRSTLLPSRLPPPIAAGALGETTHGRIQRNYRQLRFILFRLRFHTAEGLRYLIESARWRQHVDKLIRRQGPSPYCSSGGLQAEHLRPESSKVSR